VVPLEEKIYRGNHALTMPNMEAFPFPSLEHSKLICRSSTLKIADMSSC